MTSITYLYGFPLLNPKPLKEWASERCGKPLDLNTSLKELFWSTGATFWPHEWSLRETELTNGKGAPFISLQIAPGPGKPKCSVDNGRLQLAQAALENVLGKKEGELKPGWYKEYP